jgi:FKBP-type peptidyl-prolyl cis-trans isomerase SlyD
MKITNNSVVALVYELQTKHQDDEWELVENVGQDDPMYFIQGMSGLPESFEQKMEGLSAGDAFDFVIEAEDGYGEFDQEAVVELPMDIFKVEGELQEDLLQVGMQIPFNNEDGNQMVGQVVEVGTDYVLIDFNHPLAGRQMHFTGTVVKVRMASADEIDHGHVHGDGGVVH